MTATATQPRVICRAWGLCAPYDCFSKVREWESEARHYSKPPDWQFRLYLGRGSLQSSTEPCPAMVAHGEDPAFGRDRLGQGRLEETAKGLLAFVDIMDDGIGRRFVRCLRANLFAGMSVAWPFTPDHYEIVGSKYGSDIVCVHKLGRLSEVSFCKRPGFPQTFCRYELL